MSIQQIRKSVILVAAVAAIAVAGLFAGRLSADAFSHGDRSDGAQRMFAHVSDSLGLTDDQKTRVKEVLRSHASEIEGQITITSAARQALQDAVAAKPFDEAAVRSRALDLGRAQGDNAVLRAKVRAEIDPILNADQRDKLTGVLSRKRRRSDGAVQSFRSFLKSGS